MTNLNYDVYTNIRNGVTRGLPAGTESLQWVANSATLIYGKTDGVLVDTFMTRDSMNELIGWIRAHHINLKYVYITHAHSDHFFGTAMLRDAFPGVKVVATAATIRDMPEVITPDHMANIWEKLFPGQLPEKVDADAEVVSGSFELENHRIEIIEDGFTDTNDSTSLWVPDLGLIVAGDATYNGIHSFMAQTTAEDRENWINVNKRFKELNPKYVVAGHKVPENADDPVILDETIKYIQTFDKTALESQNADELFKRMMIIYPDRVNPGSLWSAAHAYFDGPLHY